MKEKRRTKWSAICNRAGRRQWMQLFT